MATALNLCGRIDCDAEKIFQGQRVCLLFSQTACYKYAQHNEIDEDKRGEIDAMRSKLFVDAAESIQSFSSEFQHCLALRTLP